MREDRLILAKLKIDFLTQEMKDRDREKEKERERCTYPIMHTVNVS